MDFIINISNFKSGILLHCKNEFSDALKIMLQNFLMFYRFFSGVFHQGI